MPVAIIMLIAAYCSYKTIAILVSIVVILKLIARMLRSDLTLSYDKSNSLFSKFVEKSNIRNLVFEPYILSPTPALQGIIYLICEITLNKLSPTPFEQELVTLPDGGTCGLAWDGGIPTEKDPLTKPLLIICPGLGGGS